MSNATAHCVCISVYAITPPYHPAVFCMRVSAVCLHFILFFTCWCARFWFCRFWLGRVSRFTGCPATSNQDSRLNSDNSVCATSSSSQFRHIEHVRTRKPRVCTPPHPPAAACIQLLIPMRACALHWPLILPSMNDARTLDAVQQMCPRDEQNFPFGKHVEIVSLVSPCFIEQIAGSRQCAGS